MSKRAVEISYELLKDFITQGYKIESAECLQGVPEDAICVEMFQNELYPSIVMVFDSVNWETKPLKSFVSCPISGQVPRFDVQFKSHYYKEPFGTTLTVNGNRFRIESKMPMSIMADRKNKQTGVLYGGSLSAIGDWAEIEELT